MPRLDIEQPKTRATRDKVANGAACAAAHIAARASSTLASAPRLNANRSLDRFRKLNLATYRSRKFSEQAPLLEGAVFRKVTTTQHFVPQMQSERCVGQLASHFAIDRPERQA